MSGAAKKQGSLWATTKAVAWSFLGVRKRSGFEDDATQLKPYHIVVVGVIGAILFVLFLIAVVNWAVAK